MIMGIDHGYYAVKTRHFSFPAGVTAYTHEPYTLKNTLQIGSKYYVCGTGRQPILRDKTINDNYYILTLAAIAMELRCRNLPAECSVTLAAGLPLARYGRDKKPFTEYLLRNGQPVTFLFEGERYKVKIESVKLFPQGYSAIALHPELVKDEPSVLLMDIGGWTVDLMRLDNNVPNAATCRSLELGMIRCMDEIQEQVRRDTGLSVTDAQVERVLAGKSCSMSYAVREDIRKLDQRIAQVEFILKNEIQDRGQLNEMRCAAEGEIDRLLKERRGLYRRNPGSPRIQEITARLKEIRRTAKLCRDIEEHSLAIEQRLEEARKEREQREAVERETRSEQEQKENTKEISK